VRTYLRRWGSPTSNGSNGFNAAELHQHLWALANSCDPCREDEIRFIRRKLKKFQCFQYGATLLHVDWDGRSRMIVGGLEMIGLIAQPEMTLSGKVNIDSKYRIWC
jgi:hypothetical protein